VITDAGREQVAARPADAPAPWDTLADGVSNEVQELFGVMRQVGRGEPCSSCRRQPRSSYAEAKQVLTRDATRLYKILADGDESKDA
jgi:bacterioferritin-associated ferredoxin